jgi:predicted tellurium resistance membrane protein TerC
MDAIAALLSDPQVWIAFFTLTALELVLGIDNIIFISILVDKLAPAQRETARRIGLFLAMFMRIALLLVLSWVVGSPAPLFTVIGAAISGPRSHPHLRRPVPGVEIDHGDPSAHRR